MIKEYIGGFKPGDICKYEGILDIQGIVSVVKWDPETWWGDKSFDNFKTGMVPVHSEIFPKRKYWWVLPHQLTLINHS